MKKRILVTGVGGRSLGAGIVHSLMRSSPAVTARWEVVAADADPFAWGLYVAAERVLLPLARAPHYISELKKTVDRLRIDAIVPGTQNEIEILALHPDSFKIPIISNRSKLIPFMMDKLLLQEELRKLNLPTIPTEPVQHWKKISQATGFPLIVKPTENSGGSRGVHLVANETEIERLIPLLDPAEKSCVQPYIGTGKDEYTVGVLSDKNGNLIDSIVIRRELKGLSLLSSRKIEKRDFPISTGYSQGHVVENSVIQKFCEKLALDMKSTGPLNLQLRVDGPNIYVLEFHPRFSGTTPMRADVGFNEVDTLLRNHLFDEKFNRFHYQTNMSVIRAFEHVVVPTSDLLRPAE